MFPFAGYCQTVQRALRSNGPFDAALIKAHRVYATLYFTALQNGQVVAAVFLRGSGNRQIDLGLMQALSEVQLPPIGHHPTTFALPVELDAKQLSTEVAYRIDLHRTE